MMRWSLNRRVLYVVIVSRVNNLVDLGRENVTIGRSLQEINLVFIADTG